MARSSSSSSAAACEFSSASSSAARLMSHQQQPEGSPARRWWANRLGKEPLFLGSFRNAPSPEPRRRCRLAGRHPGCAQFRAPPLRSVRLRRDLPSTPPPGRGSPVLLLLGPRSRSRRDTSRPSFIMAVPACVWASDRTKKPRVKHLDADAAKRLRPHLVRYRIGPGQGGAGCIEAVRFVRQKKKTRQVIRKTSSDRPGWERKYAQCRPEVVPVKAELLPPTGLVRSQGSWARHAQRAASSTPRGHDLALPRAASPPVANSRSAPYWRTVSNSE